LRSPAGAGGRSFAPATNRAGQPIWRSNPRASTISSSSSGSSMTLASYTICCDDITPNRMTHHHKANSVCRFLADTAEVRTLWSLGNCDPYLVQGDGTPTT
jgi:hypothetical protein